MGSNCGSFSGEQYYDGIKFDKFRNDGKLEEKYRNEKILFKEGTGMRTLLVKDLHFKKMRIMKQVAPLSI